MVDPAQYPVTGQSVVNSMIEGTIGGATVGGVALIVVNIVGKIFFDTETTEAQDYKTMIGGALAGAAIWVLYRSHQHSVAIRAEQAARQLR